MKISTSAQRPPFQGRLNNKQSGMTLLEVLIAMFVLAIGVLALLAVQLRAVSGVREAESQTVVSQITQNLIEGMLVNPVLTPVLDTAGIPTGQTVKSYNDYLTAGSKVASGSSAAVPAPGATLNKRELAAAQLNQFRNDLANALPESEIWFAICRDSSGAEPTYASGSVDYHCTPGNDAATVIKVLWRTDTGSKSDEGNPAVSDGYVVYTHQSRVGD